MPRYARLAGARRAAKAPNAVKAQMEQLEAYLWEQVDPRRKDAYVEVVWIGTIGYDMRSSEGHDYRHTVAYAAVVASSGDRDIGRVDIDAINDPAQITAHKGLIARLLKEALAARHSDEEYDEAVEKHGSLNSGGLGEFWTINARTGALHKGYGAPREWTVDQGVLK